MNIARTWRLCKSDLKKFSLNLSRPKGPMWIIILLSLVSLILICTYMYPLHSHVACYLFSNQDCNILSNWLPPAVTREYTDAEVASHVVIRDILDTPTIQPEIPKVAFMYLTPGTLPFEKLWDKFFQVRILHFALIW